MILNHGPFPVFRCKCGKEVWGVSHDRVVVCGQCSSLMQCVNYDASGTFIGSEENEAKKEEPSVKGPSNGFVIHQSAQALVSRKCLLM